MSTSLKKKLCFCESQLAEDGQEETVCKSSEMDRIFSVSSDIYTLKHLDNGDVYSLTIAARLPGSPAGQCAVES